MLSTGLLTVVTRMINTPPWANFEADFLDHGEGANAERRVLYGKRPRRDLSESHHFRCVCPPRHGLEEETRLGNSS